MSDYVFSPDPEEESRIREQTLQSADSIFRGTYKGVCERVVVGNLLSMCEHDIKTKKEKEMSTKCEFVEIACHLCGTRFGGTYVVNAEDTRDDKLSYVRRSAASAGWSFDTRDEGTDYCRRHAAVHAPTEEKESLEDALREANEIITDLFEAHYVIKSSFDQIEAWREKVAGVLSTEDGGSDGPPNLSYEAAKLRRPHERDCALVTTHHLTCTCRAFAAERGADE